MFEYKVVGVKGGPVTTDRLTELANGGLISLAHPNGESQVMVWLAATGPNTFIGSAIRNQPVTVMKKGGQWVLKTASRLKGL